MPCHTHPIFFARRRYNIPQPETTCRRPAKKTSDDPQCRRRRRQEEHMDRAPSSSCVCRPVACTCRQKKKKGHQMTLGDRHSRKDGRNEKTRHVQKGRQAYIQVGQQPTPPPPPVSCGIRACLVCNCTSPLARSSRPPHTQISGDSTAPSAPVDHPRTFVPGPCSGPGSMGMGWPKREGFETSIPLEQEGRTETRA